MKNVTCENPKQHSQPLSTYIHLRLLRAFAVFVLVVVVAFWLGALLTLDTHAAGPLAILFQHFEEHVGCLDYVT